MNQGIIHKVFDRRQIKRLKNINKNTNIKGLFNAYLKDVEKEVITEIKILRDKHDKCHCCPCTYADELIGDTE